MQGKAVSKQRRGLLMGGAVLGLSAWNLVLDGCASQPPTYGMQAFPAPSPPPGDPYPWLNRLSWGASWSDVEHNRHTDMQGYLARQLRPGPSSMPQTIEAQIAAMTISQRPLVQLVQDMEQRNRDANAISNDDDKKAAQQAYQQEMNRLGREAATRHVLRALYSPNQIQEQMTWFWMNHFSVHQYKANIRTMLGDYEDIAVRAHALGKFRDLLAAVAYHPVMLRYLDNEQNAEGRINENYARELMELHTLGIDGGYGQRDVQELARVLTGVGINFGTSAPKLRHEKQSFYVRKGLF